jgi:hypothetical protein
MPSTSPALSRAARIDAADAQGENIRLVAGRFPFEWTPTMSYAKITVGGHIVRAVPSAGSFRLEFQPGTTFEGAPIGRETLAYRNVRRLGDRRGWPSFAVDRYSRGQARDLLAWLEGQPVPTATARRAATPTRARATARVPGTPARTLGLARRFGVEIEFFGISRDRARQAISAAGIDLSSGYGHNSSAWNLKSDGSVTGSGLELVSPPLSGEAGLEQVKTVLRALRQAGARVDRTCGLHVHHEVRDLGAIGVVRFARSWSNNQELIDWLVAPSRRDNQGYCRRLDSSDLRSMAGVSAGDRSVPCRDRYRVVNVSSYSRYGTVEVRQHQGTLEFRKVEAWIRLGQSMLDACLAGEAVGPQSGIRGLCQAVSMEEDSSAYLIGRAIQFGAPVERVAA